MQKAFTLIELLVVVLIIGILSAVALPQYRVAVMRAKYQQMVIEADAIINAQQIYRLANGTWTIEADDLVIQRPAVPTCGLSSVFAQCWRDGMGYEVGYDQTYRVCLAHSSNAAANQVCKSETGATTSTFSEQYNINYYRYP